MKNYSAVVFRFLFLICACFVSVFALKTVAFESDFLVKEVENKTPSKRMTTDYTGRLSICSMVPDVIQGQLSQDGWNIAHMIARGDYDAAIETAKKGVLENFPTWEDGKSPVKYAEMQRLLANAYELKGEWVNALRIYAAMYGNDSSDYEWAKARVFYATENKMRSFAKVHQICMRQLLIHEPEVAESLCTLFEGADSDNVVPLRYWKDWRFLWIFRDNCVRMVYPEVYYVTILNKDAGAPFLPEMQKEAFEQFLKELQGTEVYEKYKGFWESLRQLPYDIAPDGKPFLDEKRLPYRNSMGMNRFAPAEGFPIFDYAVF